MSFAECLFPVTPPGEVLLGPRLSHEGFVSDDDLFPPDAEFSLGPSADFSLGAKKPPLAYSSRKQVEDARRSVDMAMTKKSWSAKNVENGRRSVDLAMTKKPWSAKNVENGRRSVDLAMTKKSWSAKNVENGRRSVDLAMTKKSWSLQDVEVFGDSPIGRRSSFEYKKDVTYESRRAIWEASYKQVWVPYGLEGGRARSWTSSPLLEEGIDSGPAVWPSYEDAEDDFLEEFADYFDNIKVDNVRRIQYPNLELQKIVYLDYANFSLFSNFQVLSFAIFERPSIY